MAVTLAEVKVTPTTDKLRDCFRCGTTQRLDRTKVMASARMDLESDGATKSLSCFSPILEEICQCDPSKSALLSCEAFNLEFSEKKIITSISR